MERNKDERKRPPLRLVVNNDKRQPPPVVTDDDGFMSIEELIADRERLREAFFTGLPRRQAKAFTMVERFLIEKRWPHGLDPNHGRLLVLPAQVFSPEIEQYGGTQQDELLIAVTDDATGSGLCLSLEISLPFYDDDPGIMEDAVLYSPILQYGSLFLEENRQGYLNLIYRIAFPLYPPALTQGIVARFFAAAALEVADTLHALAEYPDA